MLLYGGIFTCKHLRRVLIFSLFTAQPGTQGARMTNRSNAAGSRNTKMGCESGVCITFLAVSRSILLNVRGERTARSALITWEIVPNA